MHLSENSIYLCGRLKPILSQKHNLTHETNMNLVIVESPAKAKTIEKFLGGDYKVTSSYGHIRDLKRHDFSIDLDNKFQPIYEIPEDKQGLVNDLKKAAKKADMVWLASDEDREGEAISWHLSEVLGESTGKVIFMRFLMGNSCLMSFKNFSHNSLLSVIFIKFFFCLFVKASVIVFDF